MVRVLKLSTFVIVVLLTAFSCHKDDGGAGKGGSANLTFNLKHHGVAHNLINCTVYVKYNTQDAPANGIYDDSVKTTDADTMQVAVFNGLKNGNYYFYGSGCDTSYFQHAIGGLSYIITSQTNITDNLAISENGIPCN